jgi:heat shock protein HslJ
MKRIRLFALLLAAACVAACAGQGAANAFTESHWVLTSLNGSSEIGAALDGKDITLDFTEGQRVAGSAGCNQYNAGYTLQGQALSFHQPVSTLMACMPEKVMENETAFLQALAAVTEVQLSGDTLTLTGGGHTLVFNR